MTDKTWIKLTDRAPTAADADEMDILWAWDARGGVYQEHYTAIGTGLSLATHWMAREPRVVPEPPE